jgi:WD40 repeat protein
MKSSSDRGARLTPAPSAAARRQYTAFISYKHGAGLPFAERIAKALRTYARPLLRPRLRVFRDEEYLLPNESLPEAIRGALEASKFLVLLASAEAASSVWVRDELRIWCTELKRTSNLLIVLTKDEIAIDERTKRLDWQATTALPSLLSDYLHESPLYVDLRWVTEEQDLDLANARFKREINRLAARLNEIDPEQMLNKEVMTHRRNVWLARGAVTALAVFALFAAAGLLVAQQQRSRAEQALASERVARERAEAEAAAAASNLLAIRARQTAGESSQLGVLLAAEAVYRLQQKRLPVTSAAAQTLIDMFQNIAGIPLKGHRVQRAPGVSNEDHGATITAVAVSPDSKWIATGDGDGRVLLRRGDAPESWIELSTGERAGASRELGIQQLVFSADSKRVAASHFDEVRVWDVSAGPRVIARCTGHKQFVYDVLFTADPHWLISSSGSGLRVWNLQGASPVGELLPESKGLHAALAMNGEWVVSEAGYVWRWRDRRLIRKLPGIESGYVSLAVSPQGDKVAVGTSSGDLHVWWLATEEHKVFHHGGFIPQVAFSPDGSSLASASWDHTAKLWDLSGKEKTVTYEHDDKVEAVAFHPSGQQLATLGQDKRLRAWGTNWLAPGGPMVLGGHDGDGAASQLVFSSDGSFLVSGGYEPLPRLWRVSQLNPGVVVFDGSSYGQFESLAVNVTTQRLAAVSRHKGPDVWRLDRPDLPVVTLPDAQNNAFQVALSADGAWLASSGRATYSFLWKLDEPARMPRRLRASTGYRNKVLFSPDSSLVGGLDGHGVVLESTIRSTPPRAFTASNKPAVDFAFAPRLPRVAVLYENGSAYIWEIGSAARRQIDTGGADRAPLGIAFASDDTHVAIADASFIDWVDLGTGSTVRLVPPDRQFITKFAIAAGSNHVAAGTSAGTTLLWDVTAPGSRRDLSVHTSEVLAVALSPGGDWLASMTRDALAVWSLRDLAAAPLRLSPDRIKNLHSLTSSGSGGVTDVQFVGRHRVAASTGDDLVVVWDLDFEHLITRACEVAGRQMRPYEVINQLEGSAAVACGANQSPAPQAPAR